MWPVAPRARRMPSITAQSTPPLFAACFRFAANFGDRRTAGGVGSGSGEFSQIVAALAGPSISGFGAGFVFGSSTLRSCTHCDCASARRPLARCVPRAFELDELGVATQPCDGEDVDGDDDAALPLLTWVKPLSDVPAVESAASAAGDEASAELSLAGAAAADSSAAGAASADGADESSDVVVVVDSIAAELSSAIEAEKRSPATAASEAPAKNNAVKTKVVASRR